MFRKTNFKIIAAVLAVLLLISSVFAVSVSADDKLYCGDLEYKVEDGYVIITGISKYASGEIQIPATIDECPVVEIGNGAFWDCDTMTSVVIPDSVKVISEDAFRECDGLTNLEIPDSVVLINKYDSLAATFGFCKNLKTVVLGDGIQTLPYNAFIGCTALETVEFGANMKSTGDNAFTDCTLLKEVKLNEGLETISGSAFLGCESLTELVLPDSVKTIEGYAFSGCDGLVTFDFNKVENIGVCAFGECAGLTEVIIPDTVKVVGNPDDVFTAGAFESCNSLTNVAVGGGIESIPERMFLASYKIKNLFIDKGVLKLIDEYAFGSYDNIENVYFSGTEEEWNQIEIMPNNEALLGANIVFETEFTGTFPKGILGDADNNGSITIKDATSIQKYVAKLIAVDEEALKAADVNSDGKVNVKDATAIQKYLAKIDTGLAIGGMI
ncbi:MAG: leucine-rich repeat protein [Clostridia bacterium]|nr:leucine-rich repeat protein [Clostridia bacterium]